MNIVVASTRAQRGIAAASIGMLFLLGPLGGAPARAADPNAPLAKAHGGKVWVQEEPFPSTEGAKLGTYLAGKNPGAEVTAKVKDGPWVIHYLAVFKKPAIKGPMTVQFFERTDRKNIVDQYSPTLDNPAVVFQSTYDLSPDLGFNKGRTYVIQVGQILKKKFVPYATGEVTLK
jgi:hypothetical protein